MATSDRDFPDEYSDGSRQSTDEQTMKNSGTASRAPLTRRLLQHLEYDLCSLTWMSPEIVKTSSARSADVYSLGVLLWEVLTHGMHCSAAVSFLAFGVKPRVQPQVYPKWFSEVTADQVLYVLKESSSNDNIRDRDGAKSRQETKDESQSVERTKPPYSYSDTFVNILTNSQPSAEKVDSGTSWRSFHSLTASKMKNASRDQRTASYTDPTRVNLDENSGHHPVFKPEITRMTSNTKLLLVGKTGYGKSSTMNSILDTMRLTTQLLSVGKTGCGKSYIMNSILGTKATVRSTSRGANAPSSTANDLLATRSRYCSTMSGEMLTVVDSPGIADSRFDDQEGTKSTLDKITKAVNLSPNGFHAMVLVLNCNSCFTKAESDTLAMLKSTLGEDILKEYGILIMTYEDNFDLGEKDESTDLEKWCQDQTGTFRDLYDECGERCILFDNKTKDQNVTEAQFQTHYTALDILLEEAQIRAKLNQVDEDQQNVSNQSKYYYDGASASDILGSYSDMSEITLRPSGQGHHEFDFLSIMNSCVTCEGRTIRCEEPTDSFGLASYSQMLGQDRLHENYSHNREVLAELQPGDVIEFPHKLYSHWGIYLGNEEVAHLCDDENKTAMSGQPNFASSVINVAASVGSKSSRVCVDNFWTVVADSKAKKNNHTDSNHTDSQKIPLPGQDIVLRALQWEGVEGFDLFKSNCESFVNWCRYNETKGDQKKWNKVLNAEEDDGLTLKSQMRWSQSLLLDMDANSHELTASEGNPRSQ